ncbi:MAG: hypothetical protein ACU843_10175 [Gammaproteobacteria bacterium]
MKTNYRVALTTLLILFGLSGCLVGRLTGGGAFSGTDMTDPDAPHDVSAQITFQDVAAAICHYQDGQVAPDTIKGSYTYRETNPVQRSYTCTLDDNPIDATVSPEVPSGLYGSGQFTFAVITGNVTDYAGNWASPPINCGVFVGKAQIPGVTSNKGTIPMQIYLLDPEKFGIPADQGAATIFAVAPLDDGSRDDEIGALPWDMRAKGTLSAGNIQYHLANAQGICSATASN